MFCSAATSSPQGHGAISSLHSLGAPAIQPNLFIKFDCLVALFVIGDIRFISATSNQGEYAFRIRVIGFIKFCTQFLKRMHINA